MKPILVLVGFYALVIIVGVVFVLAVFNGRDDRFRHHCIDLKRVYENGNCLGSAEHAAAAPAPKPHAKGGERTFNDLAAACKQAGGWLNSSAISSEGPRCSISGTDSKEIDPP